MPADAASPTRAIWHVDRIVFPIVMDPRDLAIATMTWARSPDEEARLRRSIARLADIGLPVAIADKGSSPSFADYLYSVPGLNTTTQRDGLVAQVRASIDLASTLGRRHVLYVESDKEEFFRDRLITFVRDSPGGDDVGAALAARSADSFITYPPLQQYTEGIINRLCSELLECEGDYTYGPFIFCRSVLPVLASAPEDIGWGWRPLTFASARRLGLRVVHVVGHHPCPPDQHREDDEERRHRLRQLSDNIRGLIA